MAKLHFELPIYTYQIDFMRHVSNIVYIEWMEIGRLHLLTAVGLPVERLAERNAGPVLVETIIQYKRPLYLGDRVAAEVWISKLTGASAWMEFAFYYAQTATLAARGQQRGIFVDLLTGKPKRFSAEDRACFLPYLVESVPVDALDSTNSTQIT